MTNNIVQLPTPANTTGPKINTAEGTVGGNTVENQIVCIGDPNVLNQVAPVTPPSSDGQSVSLNAILVQALGLLWDGTSTGLDRLRSASAANLILKNANGAAIATRPGDWAVNNNPLAPATQATCAVAAVPGLHHVCTSIAFTLIMGGTPQTPITVNLRDDATNTGTVLWSLTIAKGASEAMTIHSSTDLNIIGSANKAMTLEFSAAGVTGTYQSVAMTGYDTN